MAKTMRPRITTIERLLIASALRCYATHLTILAAELEADRWKTIMAYRNFSHHGHYVDWKLYRELNPSVQARMNCHYDEKATVARYMAERFENMETVVNKRVHPKHTSNRARDYLGHVPEYVAAVPS